MIPEGNMSRTFKRAIINTRLKNSWWHIIIKKKKEKEEK
tara:strand:+ start:491 stop:607 length:117 start_codon:yes stop_codon:yes gene_type:complete